MRKFEVKMILIDSSLDTEFIDDDIEDLQMILKHEMESCNYDIELIEVKTL